MTGSYAALLGGAVAALVLVTAAARALLPPADDAAGGAAPPITAAAPGWEPGVWYELLDRQPTPLVWPADGKNSRWEYDPLKTGLFVDCTDFSTFELGECPAASFEVEATLFQNPWSGYFGLYYFATSGGTGRAAQFIGLEKFLPEHLPNPAAVFRGNVLVTADGRPVFNRDTAAVIPPPAARDYKFFFKVVAGKLVRAEWDGAVVPDSILKFQLADPAALQPPGGVGVFVHSTSASFRSIRLRVTDP